MEKQRERTGANTVFFLKTASRRCTEVPPAEHGLSVAWRGEYGGRRRGGGQLCPRGPFLSHVLYCIYSLAKNRRWIYLARRLLYTLCRFSTATHERKFLRIMLFLYFYFALPSLNFRNKNNTLYRECESACVYPWRGNECELRTDNEGVRGQDSSTPYSIPAIFIICRVECGSCESA